MRSKLRLFVLVGVLATATDFFVMLGLADWSLLGAELVALSVAAIVSYTLNRQLTFRDEPTARWVRHPAWFTGIAVAAALVDMGAFFSITRALPTLWFPKIIAIVVAGCVRWIAYRVFLSALVRGELRQKTERPESDGEVALSVVVPAYNESERIAENVGLIAAALRPKVGEDFEIVVVDDGSSDNTAELAAEAGARVISQKNGGKGSAVRNGIVQSKGQAVVFTDADLAYPPELILDVYLKIVDGWDVVVGSRRHQDTTTVVQARRIRSLGGRVINAFTHLVLLGQFRDTQCGIKGFRGDVGRSIFGRTRINGFGFDVEVFLIAEQDGFSLTEVPVVVENRAGSSVSLIRDTALLLRDLFKIRRWVGEGVYQPAESHEIPEDRLADC